MFNKIWFKFPERVSLKTLVLRTPALAPRTPKWYVYPRLRTTGLKCWQLIYKVFFIFFSCTTLKCLRDVVRVYALILLRAVF